MRRECKIRSIKQSKAKKHPYTLKWLYKKYVGMWYIQKKNKKIAIIIKTDETIK
jgi:hypothetical protein